MELFDPNIEDHKDLYSKIADLDDLLSEIMYAYEDQYGPIVKDSQGIYHVYKLSIGRNWTQYKQHIYYLNPGVYEQMEKFFTIKKVEAR